MYVIRRERGGEKIPPFSDPKTQTDVHFLSAIVERGQLLRDRQLDAGSLWKMFIGLKVRPHHMLSYPPTYNQEQKADFIRWVYPGQEVHPLVTVTLPIATQDGLRPVLVSGLDRRVDATARKFIAEELGLRPKDVKAARTNGEVEGWDPTQELGIRPGIIGPFLPDRVRDGLAGVFYLESSLPKDSLVEIALDVGNSAVTTKSVMEEMLVGTSAVKPEHFIPQAA